MVTTVQISGSHVGNHVGLIEAWHSNPISISFYLLVILVGVCRVLGSIFANSSSSKSSLVYRHADLGTLIELVWTTTPASDRPQKRTLSTERRSGRRHVANDFPR